MKEQLAYLRNFMKHAVSLSFPNTTATPPSLPPDSINPNDLPKTGLPINFPDFFHSLDFGNNNNIPNTEPTQQQQQQQITATEMTIPTSTELNIPTSIDPQQITLQQNINALQPNPFGAYNNNSMGNNMNNNNNNNSNHINATLANIFNTILMNGNIHDANR